MEEDSRSADVEGRSAETDDTKNKDVQQGSSSETPEETYSKSDQEVRERQKEPSEIVRYSEYRPQGRFRKGHQRKNYRRRINRRNHRHPGNSERQWSRMFGSRTRDKSHSNSDLKPSKEEGTKKSGLPLDVLPLAQAANLPL